MDRLNFKTLYLIFILSMFFACSSENEFQFISFEAYVSDKDSYPDIEETHFLYMDTTLYSQLVAAQKINYPLHLEKYSIHTNDTFIIDSEYQYEDVRELIKNIPTQVYDFFYMTFGFTRKSMNIGETVLIHDNKAYIEVHNNGTHVGLVIIQLPNNSILIKVAYVLTS